MINKNMQPQQLNTSGDKDAAALAFATMLSEQMMPKVQPEEQELELGEEMPPEPAPESTETPQEPLSELDQSEAKFTDLETKMDKMKIEMESMVKEEISSIKDMIIEALQNEQE